jgi:tetratricopeptide (TPR) repeat protein
MMQRMVMLSGKVLLDNGMPPPESVSIRRTCMGVSMGSGSRREAFTDSKGHFSFVIGGRMNTVMLDASDSAPATINGRPSDMTDDPLTASPGGMSSPESLEQRLWSCELTAELPGFRSDRISLAGRHMLDNPDVGTIVLHRIGNVEGSMISITSLKVPKDAKKEYEKGRELAQKGKTADAQAHLEKAVTIYPQYAAAWSLLGDLREETKQNEQAYQAYSKALEADPKYLSPYMGLATMAARENKWQDVARFSDKVVELDGVDFPQAYFMSSVAHYNMGNVDVAEKNARKAQQLDTQHRLPRIELLLGEILYRKADYAGAAERFRSYLKLSPNASDAPKIQEQLAALEKATGSNAATNAPAASAPKPQ